MTTTNNDLSAEREFHPFEEVERGSGGADQAEADREVFARSATLRRLSFTTASQKGSFRQPSLLHGKSLTPQLSASSILRRPATAAATTHSRVHKALREIDRDFEFSSKQTTVDGLLYSSRFSIKEIVNRKASSANLSIENESTTMQAERIEAEGLYSNNELAASTPRVNIQAKNREMQRHLSSGCIRPLSAAPSISSINTTIRTRAMPDENGFILRKRLCAKTFEDMIAAQVKPFESTGDTKCSAEITSNSLHSEPLKSPRADSSIVNLLEHGIIESVLDLSTSSDAATQGHCCRALYYLSRIHVARKSMIAHGVVASLKQLSRTISPVIRLDIAATLCHLSEQNNIVDALFFEGIDRILLRLIVSPSGELKRICALTVFNLSADAQHIRHFRDAFSQLLIAATKLKCGFESSCLCQDSSSVLESPTASMIRAIYNASLVPTFHSALIGENIPRFLASQTPLVPPAIQVWALRSFVSLSEVQSNRQLLLTSSLSELLESALVSSFEEIQEIALLTLLQLSTDEGSRVKMCNWLPISSLVRTARQHLQSRSRDTKLVFTEERPTFNIDQLESKREENIVVHLVSCILRNYCESVQTHINLIQAGSVAVLMEMSRMTELDTKVNAISSLCYLVLTFPEAVLIHIPELTDTILTLTLVQSPCSHDCPFAVKMLYNISCCDGCIPLLCQSEALLNRLLQLASDSIDSKSAELLAAITYRLVGTVPCASYLLRRGIFSQLVTFIRLYSTCRTYALNAVLRLARDGGDEFPHGEDDISHLMLALLSNGNEPKAAATMWVQPPLPARLVKRKPNVGRLEGDAWTIRSAVTLLAHLARHPKNQAALVRNEVFFRFLKSFYAMRPKCNGEKTEGGEMDQASDEDIILANCAFIYYTLTATKEGCELLVKERGIEDLIKLSRIKTRRTEAKVETIASGDAYSVKELCVLALCRLSSFVGLETRLIDQGAIETVMILALVATDSITIKALCIMTLANCLVNATPHCLHFLISQGIIWALSSLCTVEYPEVSYVCAVSLCNLSAHSSKVLKFLDAGAPRALVYLLSRTGGADAAEDALIFLVTVKTIANLATSEKLCQAFINEGLESCLSKHFLSSESSEELRQLAAMVLLRVTSANDAEISPERINSTMLLWMEQIIEMKDDDRVRNCLLTVHDLTSSSSLDVAKIDVPYVLKILVQVLHRHHSHNAQIVTLCLSVLYNMSCRMEALPIIVKSKIMPFLRQQVPWSTTTLAAQRHGNTIPFAVSLPSPELSTLTSSTSFATVQLCCLVLHNLSCWYTVNDDEGVLAALISNHAVATLHDIYFSPFSDLKEVAAVAICNIAVGKVNSARVVEDFAGLVLVHFVCSEHFLARQHRLVAAALRKLCNAPGNQVRLLNARIANAMVAMLDTPKMDIDAILILLAALRHLSSCKDHIPRLLSDGVLPCLVKLAERPSATVEMSSYCFEIISNLCSIDFQDYLRNCPEINVVGTLTKLSDRNNLVYHGQYSGQNAFEEQASSLDSYCARGKVKLLSLPVLITDLMKSTTSTTGAIMNTLQIKANFVVHAKKWTPRAQPGPRNLAMLACKPISHTDNRQAISSEVKQRIGCFLPLPKSAFIRNEKNDAIASFSSLSSDRQLFIR